MNRAQDLDCGSNSCLFGGRGKGGMRTNGPCRCVESLIETGTEQRAEIARLTHELTQANETCAALREGEPLGPVIGAQTIFNQAKEIEALQAQLATAKREVWSQIIQQIDYRHCTVTMDQISLKEWCMAQYKKCQQKEQL